MRSEAMESYRRAAMLLATAAREDGVRAALLCSPTHGEGTTTTVVNLARQLQECFALRSLVVELNRATPSLAKRFRLDRGKSLEAIASGRRGVGECIQETRSGLAMIVAGTGAAAGDRLDEPGVLQKILDEGKGEFGFTLVDAPPMLSHADALLATAVVPTLILVVQSGKTPYEVLDRLRRDLQSRNIAIFGCVLNKHKRVIPGWIYRAFIR